MTHSKLTASQIRAFLPKMPFNAHLGIRLARLHEDGLTIECTIRPEMMNGAGALHGGVTATLVDAAAGIATMWYVGGTRRVTTVELKVNYFRPVVKGRIRARAHLLRVGKTLSIARVDVSDSTKNLIGTALVTYMLLDSTR